jgi:hypothetical protein
MVPEQQAEIMVVVVPALAAAAAAVAAMAQFVSYGDQVDRFRQLIQEMYNFK